MLLMLAYTSTDLGPSRELSGSVTELEEAWDHLSEFRVVPE